MSSKAKTLTMIRDVARKMKCGNIATLAIEHDESDIDLIRMSLAHELCAYAQDDYNDSYSAR